MVLIHTPRVISSVVKGLLRRRQEGRAVDISLGIGPKKPHTYVARVSPLDIDYLGHMNNASYLLHAEYARWQLIAYNGLLSQLFHDKVDFVMAGAALRYRREIRPVFRQFQVETFVGGLDERNLWVYQTFRYPQEGPKHRIRAQVALQGAMIHKRKVVDPRVYLKEQFGLDAALVDELSLKRGQTMSLEDMFTNYRDLMTSFQVLASDDDDAMNDRYSKY